jgi:hypothetical protein
MPTQTQITTQPVLGPFPTQPVTPGSLNLVFTPVDTVNGNYFAADPFSYFSQAPGNFPQGSIGGDVLLVWNNTGGSVAFTLTSQTDSAGRSADGSLAPYQIAANTIMAFKFSSFNGWADGSGFVYPQCAVAGVQIAVLQR